MSSNPSSVAGSNSTSANTMKTGQSIISSEGISGNSSSHINGAATEQSSLSSGPQSSSTGVSGGQGDGETSNSRERLVKCETMKERRERSMSVESSDSENNDDPEVQTGVRRSPPEKSFDERVSKAPKRIKQVLEYAKLMEDRVQALETKVQALEGEKSQATEDESNDGATPATNATPASGYPLVLPEDGFNLNPEVKKHISAKEFHNCVSEYVIDVLYGGTADALASQGKSGASQAQSTPMPKRLDVSGDQASKEPRVHTLGTRPSRVKINSLRLRVALSKVTGQSVALNTRQILAPFKLFTDYEQEIRQHEKVLEEKVRPGKNTAQAISTMDKGVGDQANQTELDDTSKLLIMSDMPAEELPRGENPASNIAEPTSKPVPPDDVVHKDASAGSVEGEGDTLDGEEDIDESTLDVGCIYEVMETCQVSRRVASKALVAVGGNEDKALLNLQSNMSPAELEAAEVVMSEILLPEWRALLRFLDEDLKDALDICAQIRSGELKKISFHDLHHLFKPGDVVFASDERRMDAFQVLAVSGGRRVLTQGGPNDIIDDPEGTTKGNPEKAAENPFRSSVRYNPFMVECFYYDFDGSHFGAVGKDFVIKGYDDLKPVTSLTVYPAQFRHEGGDWKTDLVRRGEKFVRLCASTEVAHKQYVGRTLDDPSEELDSRVIIDFHFASTIAGSSRPNGDGWVRGLVLNAPFEADMDEVTETIPADSDGRVYCHRIYCQVCSHSNIRSPIFNEQTLDRDNTNRFFERSPLLSKDDIVDKDLGPDELMLLPLRLFGFVLRSRKWARLNIDAITDVTTDKDNFKKLVLPDGHRDIVQALVETHFQQSDPVKEHLEARKHDVDLVRGKGKGLIVLLHGAPGVGKTSTAECVAEYTQRPLYAITCGDIGETASAVEDSLDRCFQLAHKWGCVLLLDEADVFLAKRDKADLRRNALVSVFLRTLEYYAGILFLTTNRVALFDDAFKSRIHMSLYYPALDGSSTKQVWQMNIERTCENMKQISVDESEIVQFGISHYKKAKKAGSGKWNRRQIRNAFQTAIALAAWEVKQGKVTKAKLTKAHFEKVAEASRAFDKYLEEVHGQDEEGRAGLEKIRADWMTPSKSKVRERKPKETPSKDGKSKKSQKGHAEEVAAKKKKSKKHETSEEDSEAGSGSGGSSSEASSS